MLGDADSLDFVEDNEVTVDDLYQLCMTDYHLFEPSDDDDYLRDHPTSDLVDYLGLILDMDSNGDINIYHAETNLANYVDSDDLDQESADFYFEILSGALTDETDYKGDGSILLEDIAEYIDNNYIYFDW